MKRVEGGEDPKQEATEDESIEDDQIIER